PGRRWGSFERLWTNRSPGRIRSSYRSRQATLVWTGQINLPARGFARVTGGTETLHNAADRGPGRCLILPAVGQVPHIASIRRHDADAQIAHDVGEGDLVSTRAPFRGGCAPTEEADAALSSAIRVHHIDLLVARTVAFEHDLRAVRRVRSADIDTGRIGQPSRRSACGGHAVDVRVTVHGHRIEDGSAIRRPARSKGRVLAFRHQRLPTAADVVDIDARVAV